MIKQIVGIMFSVLLLASCNQRMIQPEQIVKKSTEKESTEELIEDPNLNDDAFGIRGREVISIPNLASMMVINEEGLIVVKMCVNPNGDVIFTEIIPSETTITNKKLLKTALKLASKYKYEKDVNAPDEQCGKFSFKLDIDKRKK